jgi:hypothetical protein
MGHGYKMLGFAVIIVLYVVVGVMAALGTIWINRKFLTGKQEQIFYGIFMIGMAAFYLAFTAYFEADTAWRVETVAVAVFATMGLLGVQLPVALIIGYPLHGLWDFVHELQAHGVHAGFEAGQLTAIPLAYGFFCAAYDFSVAVYFYMRRDEWNAAWKAAPQRGR